jgi:hypothetical protein
MGLRGDSLEAAGLRE